MKRSHIALIAVLAATIAAPVTAQMGPGMGGMGPGKSGRFAFNQGNTPAGH